MKCFFQYWAARFGWWTPKVGEVYRADRKETHNPFNAKPSFSRVVVTAVDSGNLQYAYENYPEIVNSATFEGFASYYLRVVK